MTKEIMNILFSALGIIITGLASLLVAKFTQWINTKIEDKKAATYLSTIMELCTNCVKETYQVYVDELKKEGKFDKEAQEKALEMCMAKVKASLSDKILVYIKDNFGDITPYLRTLIESIIYSMKNWY